MSSFKEQSDKHYVFSLLDLIYGSSIEELKLDHEYYLDIEEYHICDGILRALKFIEDKSMIDIKKELDLYEIKQQL